MNKNVPARKGEFLIYQTDDGQVKIDVRLEDETIWLTQQMMADLFQTTQQNISLHIKNILEEGELSFEATHKKYLSVRQEGNRKVQRQLDYYNLDMIISVGYRVKSLIATRFRIWATEHLKEYIIKGFVLDDERLKNPPVAGSAIPDYFDEMLARIRDIRASERRMYLRVREISAMAGDYDPSWSETTKFFSFIQNKLHFAATGVSVHGISKGNLAKVNIFLPQLDEQKAIASVLSAADSEIEVLGRKLALLKDQKKFLVNNLVTGTIRLPQFRDTRTATGFSGENA